MYYTIRPSFSARAATRTIPTATGAPSSGSKRTNVGAIAGGTVGGLVVLIIVLCLILFCLRRRKRAVKVSEPQHQPEQPPAELAVTPIPQEMGTPDANKYMAVHEQADPNSYAMYAGSTPVHARSASHEYNMSNAGSLSPYGHTAAFPAPSYSELGTGGYGQQSPRQHNDSEYYFRDNSSVHNASQASTSPSNQYTYTAPTSPRHHPHSPTQQQPQTYFPPPPDPTSRPQRSPASTHYSGETQHGQSPNISTMNTPAQFYAQPVPHRLHSGGADRRPVQGRFIEDGQI